MSMSNDGQLLFMSTPKGSQMFTVPEQASFSLMGVASGAIAASLLVRAISSMLANRPFARSIQECFPVQVMFSTFRRREGLAD